MRRATWMSSVLALAALSFGFGGGSHAVGTSRLIARVPASPGFPEGVVVRGPLAFVSGPAAFGTAGGPPSVIRVYDTHRGRLLRSYDLEGEDLSVDHAISGIAADGLGRLYITSTQLGIVRMWPYGAGRQRIYASAFPDLPLCASAPPPCSPMPVDLPALPNDLAFDASGNLYVTDTRQAVIWRIAPGGGAPEVWFSDPRFIADFGPNGVRVSPDGAHLYVGVTGPPGVIYRLPLGGTPTAADLEVFATFGAEGPDGLAFARSGNLYVTLAYSNHIVAVDPSGAEVARFSGPIVARDGSTIPFDGPAVLAFDGHRRRVLVANHAIGTGDASHFALFATRVAERGARLFEPWVP